MVEIDDKELDYAIAEYLLDWEKIYVENVVDFEGNGWEKPNGNMLSIDDTPNFSSDMREALKIYEKYKEKIDKKWDKEHFQVNAKNLCIAALSVNNIDL